MGNSFDSSELEKKKAAGRDYLRLVLTTTRLKPTNLAKKILVAPSTINRFLTEPGYPHALSIDTLVRIVEVTGCALTPAVMDAYGLNRVFVSSNPRALSTADPDLLATVLKACGVEPGEGGYQHLAKRMSDKLMAVAAALQSA